MLQNSEYKSFINIIIITITFLNITFRGLKNKLRARTSAGTATFRTWGCASEGTQNCNRKVLLNLLLFIIYLFIFYLFIIKSYSKYR